MVVFIAVADDVSETRNPSIVQYVHLFSIAREVRVMGSHLQRNAVKRSPLRGTEPSPR